MMDSRRMSASERRKARGGYTLVELIVAVGLFASIMTLASGAYLIMLSVARQTQSIATGIDNLSFVLESMTRTIRTGTHYSPLGSDSFSFVDQNGQPHTYSLGSQAGASGSVGAILLDGAVLTAPTVNVTALTFYTSGTVVGDTDQPHVTITVTGAVTSGPGKTEPFNVETGATMRGSDI